MTQVLITTGSASILHIIHSKTQQRSGVLCHPKCISVVQLGEVEFSGADPFLSLPSLFLFSFLIVTTVPLDLSLFSFLVSSALSSLVSLLGEVNSQYLLFLVMKHRICHTFWRCGMTKEQPFVNLQGATQNNFFFILFVPHDWSKNIYISFMV